MLDNEIKKLLQELKMDNLIDTLEGNPQKTEADKPEVVEEVVLKEPEIAKESNHEAIQEPYEEEFSYHQQELNQEEPRKPVNNPLPHYVVHKAPTFSFSGAKMLLALTCAILAPAAYMLWHTPNEDTTTDATANYVAYNDSEDSEAPEAEDAQPEISEEPPVPLTFAQQREANAASWARQIVDINVNIGQNVHVLWDLLRRRKEELDVVTTKLTDLLTDNAQFRQDLYFKTANSLLSRYQAIDARYSVEIADQMRQIASQVKKRKDKRLTSAYAAMLAELGCQTYSSRQIQIVQQLVAQELKCKEALLAVDASKSLAELEYNLRLADQTFMDAKQNELVQIFQEDQPYQAMLSQKCIEGIDRLLVEENAATCTADARVLLEGMLAESGISQSEGDKYMQRFDALANQITP